MSWKRSGGPSTWCRRKGPPAVCSRRSGATRRSPTSFPRPRDVPLASLANPIRRAVVGFVFASGPVAYSAILKKNFVDSSSKLSFHLQKLQSDGLLTKVDAGRYAVTDAGQRAWHVVRALSNRKAPSLLISKS